MSFLTPTFLILGLLAVPIILLYMLRLRRREMLVSSTMLWQKLLRDREANAPWQRLKRNLLLLLQLLILASLVFALARPFIPVPSIVSGNIVVLLDGSASMQATDVEPTRFEVARSEVNKLVNDLGGRGEMTLILAGHTPRVLVAATTDRDRLRRALAAAEPDQAEADWPAAFALAAGAAQGFRDARIILVSDGGIPDDLPSLPAETTYLPIGTSAENLAISALAARNTQAGPQLFANVRNLGRIDQQALFSLTLDGVLYDSRQIIVPAESSINLTWDLPTGTVIIKASLAELDSDFLALDNVAWTVHEGGVQHRTLLVTEGNIFLEQALAVLPGLETFKAKPGSDLIASSDESFDLYVFDGVSLPSPLPAGDILVINPQPQIVTDAESEQPFTVTGSFSNTVAIRLADTPLLQFVDWRNVHIRQASLVNAPWAQSLVTAEGGPIVLIGEHGGSRIGIFAFDLHDSDLPLQIAFPILMANITGWLSPGRAFDAPTALQPGTPVEITPGIAVGSVAVDKPDGSIWRSSVTEEAMLFTDSNQLGLYKISFEDSSGTRPAGRFAVNLFSLTEANIEPAPAVEVGLATVESTSVGNIGQRELWSWLLAVAFVVLLIEWWIQHRGTRIRSVDSYE